VLALVRAARRRNGSRSVFKGAGEIVEVVSMALFNSSRYMSDRWKGRLEGIRVSDGLKNKVYIKSNITFLVYSLQRPALST